MFLVKRKISPYTNSDLIIGIFDSNETAKEAKEQYIDNCKIFDKWKEQAYKETNLELDITIQDIVKQVDFDYDKSLQTVFVVSRFDEAFGQIGRTIESFFKTEEEAEKYCDEKNDEDDLEMTCAFYYDFEQIDINKIYYDK